MKTCTVTLATTTSKGHTYWQLRWDDPVTGKRRSENVGRQDKVSERTAKKHLVRKENELELNPALRSKEKAPTLSEWIDTVIEWKQAANARPTTIALYQQAKRFLVGYFGNGQRINEITRLHAKRFAAALQKNELNEHRTWNREDAMSATTVRKHLSTCRAIFNTASEQFDWFGKSPFASVKLPKVEPSVWHKVTPDEYKKLYAAADDGWKVLLALCRLAALRRSDALRLKWSNVKLTEGKLDFIQHKTGRRCRVPISPELREVLQDIPRNLTLDGDDLVLPESVYVGNIGRDFKVLCKRAKVKSYPKPLHSLRKSCIDDWVKRGYAANVVKEWAGHADIKTTLTFYSIVELRDYERAASQSLFGESDATSDATSQHGQSAKHAKSG